MEAVVRAGRSPQREVLRARIVLLLGTGMTVAAVAERVRCTEKTVRKWRDRFAAEPRLSSLRDAPRSGRPSTIPLWLRCELVSLACDRPAKKQFRKVWTAAALAEALRRQTRITISVSEVRRTLHAASLRPHRVRMWLHSPDPDFRTKVRRVCKLYRSPPTDGVVICVDEKTGMQALEHKHPMRLARCERDGRMEFEYIRHGTRTLLAGFNPHTGQVIAQCRRRRTAKDLLAFMELLAKAYPTGKVYVVWDNLNIHARKRWTAFNRRHGNRFRFVYTPIHASWVNQIEIWFSILHRRVLKYGSFATAKELVAAVMGFMKHWNRREAHPFRWTFTGELPAHAAA